MPYKLRLLLQGRPDRTSNGNQYMRGFVMSMDDFMFRQHGKRGEGSIVVRPTWKNSTALKGRNSQSFLLFLEQQFSTSTVCQTYDGPLADRPVSTCAMKSGVHINGYSTAWKVGCACAYVHEGETKFGVVLNMFYREEERRDLLVFQIAPHRTVENLVLGKTILFTVSSLPCEDEPHLVLWKSVQYKCLMIPEGPVSTVLVVNSSKSAEATFDYTEL